MTPRRYELSDFEWSIVEPLLPSKSRGVARSDDREEPNGIYWRLRTGSPWADIPERSGPTTTGYNRFVRWVRIGDWNRIFEAVSKAYDVDLQIIDSSSIRVHQHCANSKKGARRNIDRYCERRWKPLHGPLSEADRPQKPCPRRRQWPAILLKLTPGQAHDGEAAPDEMLNGLAQGQILFADRGYYSEALRARLAQRGARGNITMPGRVNVSSFGTHVYSFRNLVERFFNKLIHFRAVATRLEKLDANYLLSSRLRPSIPGCDSRVGDLLAGHRRCSSRFWINGIDTIQFR